MNLFFQSVSARLPPLTAGCSFLKVDVPYLPDKYVIRPEEVECRLMRLKVNKATGSDGIPAWVLRDFALYLAGPICAIFNNSLREGYLPELWKTAVVVPLPKKNPPTEVDSHLRPTSLTPVVSKVLESFTCEWMKETIQDSINPRQYGAISGSSKTHAMIEMLHFILSSLETRSHHARALLLDYSKAFDSVNHHILLQKLHEAGSPAILTRWVPAFLLNRKQRVKIGDQYSSLLTLNGGWGPQGTLFGPLSFIVHLGDFSMPCALDFTYVDDTSSCTASDKPDSPAMQANADYTALWARNNDMKLNAQKTLELVLSPAKKPAQVINPVVINGQHIAQVINPVVINGQHIAQVTSAKLLGVTLSVDLKWNTHIVNIVGKANQRVLMMCQLKKGSVSAAELIRIYISVIRPILEYTCHSALTVKLSKDLARVQKRALRIVYGPGDYCQHLERSGLPRLSDRRSELCRVFYRYKDDKPSP